EQQKCMVSQDIAYQIFATCCTFYVPLLVILFLYWKIYQTARKRIHRRRPKPINSTGNNNQYRLFLLLVVVVAAANIPSLAIRLSVLLGTEWLKALMHSTFAALTLLRNLLDIAVRRQKSLLSSLRLFHNCKP
ncbi:hypothetical protein DOY81_009723, partial [Sarcophaga bullata]